MTGHGRARRRLGALFLACLVLVLCACGGQPSSLSAHSGTSSVLLPESSPGDMGAKIALVCTEQQRDSAFGQAVSGAINRFSGEEGISWAPYLIEGDSLDAAYSTIELSVKGGAEVIILIGAEMEEHWRTAQRAYPEVTFYTLDTQAKPKRGAALGFGYAQGGYLAGYAAVYEGARRLYFLWENDLAARNYCNGILLGAEAAAAKLGLDKNSISLETVLFTEEATQREKREYFSALAGEDTGVLFAMSSENQTLSLALVRDTRVRVVGIEPTLTMESSDVVLTVLRKTPGKPLYNLLMEYKEEGAPSSGFVLAQVANGGVEMEIAAARLRSFGQAEYDGLIAALGGRMLITVLERYTAEGKATSPPELTTMPSTYVQVVQHDQSQPEEGPATLEGDIGTEGTNKASSTDGAG